ncbi:hypothetical protein [Pseudoxanthobacter sp.]|uniref:hypothetical protein n=1 Tax=Pseudoxanthobacter sp. TaxID=1925742 RepID=UPI002FE3DA31
MVWHRETEQAPAAACARVQNAGIGRRGLAGLLALAGVVLAVVAGGAAPAAAAGVVPVQWNGGWQPGGQYAPPPPPPPGGWYRGGYNPPRYRAYPPRYREVCRVRRERVVLRRPYAPPVVSWRPVRVCRPVR